MSEGLGLSRLLGRPCDAGSRPLFAQIADATARYPPVPLLDRPQSFCHTAAYPKPVDVVTHHTLPDFIMNRGGVSLRPGDGIIHSWLNRMLLPDTVGTGGDSHTRFPIGISFPAGSGLVAFAGATGIMPLDMPESVRCASLARCSQASLCATWWGHEPTPTRSALRVELAQLPSYPARGDQAQAPDRRETGKNLLSRILGDRGPGPSQVRAGVRALGRFC